MIDEARRDLSSPPTSALPAGSLLVAIPLYKAPDLIPGLFGALGGMADEIDALGATLLLLNDSPDHEPLRLALAAALPALRAAVPVELIENVENIGFVRTANRAFSIAIERGNDVLLLNSDTLPTHGAFAEMVAVARLDPMIGFVSPRSNNASICNSPWPDEFRGRDPERSLADHRTIADRLPRYTLVPTAVGFCLFVRCLMLQEFGLFDEIYGGGYNEENDLIRRCNQRGFRAALANHAFVYHLGSASFLHSSLSAYERELVNGAILRQRYPEYDLACHRYFTGAGHRAERLLSGLIPADGGKLRIVFECELLKPSFNGTFELAKNLIAAFARRHGDRYDIGVYSSEDAFLFHGLDTIPGVRLCGVHEIRNRPFAVAYRLAQPFALDDLTMLSALAPITGTLMLDTIALDCQQIDPSDLSMLWRLMAETSDIVGYISEFSRDQFRRRFDVPEYVEEFVALCSTDIDEYSSGALAEDAIPPDPPTILLVGNHYPHKHVRETLATIQRMDPTRHVSLLGVETDDTATVKSHEAGLLPQKLVDDLYAAADVVLFPSHYEGFGLPIMHALARGKRVVARDLPPAREIRDRTTLGANIHLAETTEQLVSLALAPPDWDPRKRSPAKAVQRWDDAADALAAAFSNALAKVSYDRCSRHQARISAQRLQLTESRLADADVRAVAAETLLTLLNRGRPTLGNDLVDVLDLCVRHGDARDRSRNLSASIHDAMPIEILDSPTILSLTDGDAPASFELVEERLLRWSRRLVIGGALRLDLATAGFVDPSFPEAGPVTVARALLTNAGFAPLGLREADGRLIADATRIADWAGILPGPDADPLFIRLMYRQALGRDPDPQGEATFAGLLEQSNDREVAMLAIYRSSERRAYVYSRLAAHRPS